MYKVKVIKAKPLKIENKKKKETEAKEIKKVTFKQDEK